jgi:hypothetical protein
MKNHDARFLLGAYRPDGRDSGDPLLEEAIAQAQSDPALRRWFDAQQTFDATVTAKLREIAPTPGLREAILVGARASRPRRRWWASPVWLAAAAAMAVGLGLAVKVRLESADRPTLGDLTAFALNDLEGSHDQHVSRPPALAGIQAQLANASLPLTRHLGVDLGELRRDGCRSVRVAGRDVFEVCFQRDGTSFHLYAARRDDFASGAAGAGSPVVANGQFAAQAWSDSHNAYALVTRAGSEALRRLL